MAYYNANSYGNDDNKIDGDGEDDDHHRSYSPATSDREHYGGEEAVKDAPVANRMTNGVMHLLVGPERLRCGAGGAGGAVWVQDRGEGSLGHVDHMELQQISQGVHVRAGKPANEAPLGCGNLFRLLIWRM